jgi:hypothetical protein
MQNGRLKSDGRDLWSGIRAVATATTNTSGFARRQSTTAAPAIDLGRSGLTARDLLPQAVFSRI